MPVWLDVVDAIALGVIALASPDPQTVFALTFAAIWYCALFGSTQRSLLRCSLYVAAIAATIPLWLSIPGHVTATDPAPLVTAFPLMFLTVLVGRQLTSGQLVREENHRRSMVLADVGSKLIGMIEPARIHALAWSTMTDICSATPHMYLIHALREGPAFSVVAATAGLDGLPNALPADFVDRPTESLAGLRGMPKHVTWSDLPAQYDGADRWVLIGATRAVSQDAVMSLQTLISQLTLAFSNSGVHQNLTVRATVDALTGLANRVHFNTELLTVLSRPGTETQVLFIDLDDFKDVNDMMGHQAGDAVLVEVAARLRAFSRADDLCARLGGDEFAILLPRAGVAEAGAIAHRIVERIAEPIIIQGHRTAQIGASIGIATAGEGTGITNVIHQADVAMYAAKAQGKGRVQVFKAALLDGENPQVAFEAQLADAVRTDEIVVYYQPIVSTSDAACIAVECLARWHHPSRGLLDAEQFLADAERIGCDIALGALVVRRACFDGAAYQAIDPGAPIAIHVNVSGNQVADEDFFDTVVDCLFESGLAAQQLVFELTASVPLNSGFMLRRLNAIAEIGVQIAIEESGTGYTSLSTLRTLPVDIIKLDASFIDNAIGNKIDRAAIEAIVHMSRQLGLQTIATRIERSEQHDFVRGVGIDAEQGYLQLRPAPAPAVTAWLRANRAAHPRAGKLGILAPRATA